MNEYTANQFVELTKVLNCLSFDEFCDMFGRDPENDPGDYMIGKYQIMRENFLRWLCDLDAGNRTLVFDYAAKKYELYALKRQI